LPVVSLVKAAKPMHGMACGMGYFRDLLFSLPMTLDTHGAGNDDSVMRTVGHFARPFHKGLDQHLVTVVNRRIMATMAFDFLMDAGLPGSKSILHDMTIDAKGGVMLRIVINMQGTRAYDHNKKQDL
jgi:hypothetical protein